MRSVMLISTIAISILIAAAPPAPAQEAQYQVKKVKGGEVWWREKPGAPMTVLRPNQSELKTLAPETQVHVSAGAQLTLTVIGADPERSKLVLGPADWVTLPRPPEASPLVGGRSLAEIHREFERVQVIGGRKKGGCGERNPVILAPPCGATIPSGRFEIRWTPGSNQQFLNVELVAGSQQIRASSPVGAGSLRTQALTAFLQQAQSASDPVGVTLTVRLPQGETVSVPFNVLSRTGEMRFEQEFEQAGRLDAVEGSIVRAVLFERNGMWPDSMKEYQKLLESSPESSILLRKLADLGCVVGGTDLFNRYISRLDKQDREGLLCEF